MFNLIFFILIIVLMIYMVRNAFKNQISIDAKQHLSNLIGVMRGACNVGDKADETIIYFLYSCFITKQTPEDVEKMMRRIRIVSDMENRDLLFESSVRALKRLLNTKPQREKLLTLLNNIYNYSDDNGEGWDKIMYIADCLEVNLMNIQKK